MANNRMWLVCKICIPGEFIEVYEWGHLSKENPQKAMPISKWYPYSPHSATMCVGTDLQDFYDAHSHNGEEYPFRLEYECPEKEEK
jgi:hypothetical protein